MSAKTSRKIYPAALELPRRRRGRQTLEGEAEYQSRRGEFCRLILQIRSTMDFAVGPFGFWDDLKVYVEVAVEKLDLRNLFEPVCAEFFVPLTNFKGWSDINSRAAMMRRFDEHESAGKRCVLLLCGDHDPGGLADAVPDYLDLVTIVADRDPAGVRFANALAERLSDRRMNHRISFVEPPS